jgi:hypothetical protein
VKSVFLHGDLEEDMYMDQPEGFVVAGKEEHVCRLKKSLYGLKQSSRQWYKRFDSFMISNNFHKSALYFLHVSNFHELILPLRGLAP